MIKNKTCKTCRYFAELPNDKFFWLCISAHRAGKNGEPKLMNAMENRVDCEHWEEPIIGET